MAKTQNDHLKDQEKDQNHHQQSKEIFQTQLQPTPGLGTQLTHAVISPQQSNPETMQLLQKKYGNNEVKRIIQPESSRKPIIDRNRTLDKHITEEIQRARGGGQPLGSDLSSDITPKFNKNLDQVRLHTDKKSDQISRQINARAFTVGNDIFFRQGAYSPHSEQGRQTLMHELTHVVQQSTSTASSGPLKLGKPDDQHEREAEHVAHSQTAAERSGSAVTQGVVQRSIFSMAKTKVTGLFGRGGSKSSVPTTPPPSPTPAVVTPPVPQGLTQEVWEQLKQVGVKDETEWNTLVEAQKDAILSLLSQDVPLARKLISAKQNLKWPNDDTGNNILDTTIITAIDGTLKLTFDEWSQLTLSKRKYLISLLSESYVPELAKLAVENKWPKDGSNNDITDESVFKTITKTWKVSLDQWNLITEADQREFLLKNSNKIYADELVRAGIRKLWPKDGSNNPILDDSSFTKITDGMGINLWTWININNAGQRDFLLKAGGSLGKDTLKELAFFAKSGIWPKDGNGNDISSSNDWKKIKDAFNSMTPVIWNRLDIQVRKDALAESDNTKRKNIINSANYQSKSKETKLEKAGGVASHPGFDLAAGTLGTASGIVGAAKGTGENVGVDRASGIVGATGDLLSMGTSATQFVGSASKISRGKKMANDPNSSLAMKALGRKELSRGKWGAAQSGLGFLGSAASFGGNLTKSMDPTADQSKNTSSGFGVASGFLGMFGSGLGLGKGSASMHSARKRSRRAKGFMKTAAAGTALTTEEQDLNEVAQFTSKSQNKTGKGLGIFKNVTSFLGSAINTIGSIGSFAGLSVEAGFGLGIAGAALSGVGVLGGVGQWASEYKGKPKDADLDAQADKLIRLLKLGDPQGKEAARFVKDVLKIDLVNLAEPNTWSSWIEEDENAAKALIKSKLSKF